MVPPPDETPKSLGDGVTGSDVEPSVPGEVRSLGDQSTAGDMGSSVSDLDDMGVGLDDDLEIVDLAARYEFEGELGRGGMGEVMLARDRRLKRQVAIKRLKEELGASRKAAQRFLTEAESIAALNHFNIVQIFDYGRASDGPFIVMEYVDGGSLAETLAKGRLEQATAVELIDQLCQALTVTHAQGVIHRPRSRPTVFWRIPLRSTHQNTERPLTRNSLIRSGTRSGGRSSCLSVITSMSRGVRDV